MGALAKASKGQPIVFRRNIRVGSPDAENDDLFLESCFIDTGDLDVLKDCRDPRRIVLGRTGSGKTALLQKILQDEEHVIELPPEALSISYISNSNIIAFFENVGLRLNEFYVLLWKHVITVELLRKKFDIHNLNSQSSFKRRIETLFSDKSKKKALEYLEEFEDKFWEETQYRVESITTTIENQLKGSLGAKAKNFELNAEGAKKLSETQKKEVVEQAMNAVSKIQIRELHNIIPWLADDVFNDAQQKYFIVIDRLDEEWVDEGIKYKLIKALIDTVRAFNQVKSVKIIISLRSDLLHRVVEQTSGSGFQYEKYKSQFLELRWNETLLKNLIDKRINQTFKLQYEKNVNITLSDILSDKEIDTKKPINYILDRTFFRPREIISFINECILQAEGKAVINRAIIKKAENTYSYERLRELKSEWGLNYPLIAEYISILERKPREFRFGDISKKDTDDLICKLAVTDDEKDPMSEIANSCFLDGNVNREKCKKLPSSVFRILYEIGIIGIKQYPSATTRWSFKDEASIAEAELNSDTIIKIHPAYWISLGITPKSNKGN